MYVNVQTSCILFPAGMCVWMYTCSQCSISIQSLCIPHTCSRWQRHRMATLLYLRSRCLHVCLHVLFVIKCSVLHSPYYSLQVFGSVLLVLCSIWHFHQYIHLLQCVRTLSHTLVLSLSFSHVCACAHACIHTHPHTRSHTHTHTITPTHTLSVSGTRSFFISLSRALFLSHTHTYTHTYTPAKTMSA